MSLSRYRIMWLFVMFDLPVDTQQRRREYAQFRKSLIRKGFSMLQFSVYAKHVPTEDAAEPLKAVVHATLPPQGQVRLLTVTDHQFGKMASGDTQKRPLRYTSKPAIGADSGR